MHKRCSECESFDHHWIDDMDEEGPEHDYGITHSCKHCNAVGIECDNCSGSGSDPDDEDVRCDDCNGSGVVFHYYRQSDPIQDANGT